MPVYPHILFQSRNVLPISHYTNSPEEDDAQQGSYPEEAVNNRDLYMEKTRNLPNTPEVKFVHCAE